jgi:hypothetical protein
VAGKDVFAHHIENAEGGQDAYAVNQELDQEFTTEKPSHDKLEKLVSIKVSMPASLHCSSCSNAAAPVRCLPHHDSMNHPSQCTDAAYAHGCVAACLHRRLSSPMLRQLRSSCGRAR